MQTSKKSWFAKILVVLCSIICCVAIAFGITACGGSGKSIAKIERVGDELVITYTDDSTDRFQLKDGKDGADGKDGEDGKDGTNGTNGTNGKDGKDGVDGTNGKDGKDGVDGTNGKDGKDGVDGKDGKGISKIEVVAGDDNKQYLKFTYTDNTTSQVEFPGVIFGGSSYDPDTCVKAENGKHELYLTHTLTAATCNTEGLGIYVCKNDCGGAFVKAIEKTQHNWETKTTKVEAGKECTTDIYEWQECSICHEKKDEHLKTNAPGHKWAVVVDETTGEALKDENGNDVLLVSKVATKDAKNNDRNICEYGYFNVNICKVCGEQNVLEFVPGEGHAVDSTWMKASEVTKDGTYAAWYKEGYGDPTYDKAGYIFGYCSECEDYGYVAVPAFKDALGAANSVDLAARNDNAAYYTEKVIKAWTTCTDRGEYEYALNVEYTYTGEDGEEATDTLTLTYDRVIEPTLHFVMINGEKVAFYDADAEVVLENGEYRAATAADSRDVITNAVYDYDTYKDYFFFFTTGDKEYNCQDEVRGYFICEGNHVEDKTHGVTPVNFKGSHVKPTETAEKTLAELGVTDEAMVAKFAPASGKDTMDKAAVATAIEESGIVATLDKNFIYTVAAGNDTVGFTFWVCSKCNHVEVEAVTKVKGHLYAYEIYTVTEDGVTSEFDHVAEVEAWLTDNQLEDDPYEYVLYIYDTLSDYKEFKGVQDTELTKVTDSKELAEHGLTAKAPTCVEAGVDVYKYTGVGPDGSKSTFYFEVANTKLAPHSIVIDGKSYYMVTEGFDTSAFENEDGSWSVTKLAEANFLADAKYLDVAYFEANGIAVYYIDNINIFYTTTGKKAEDCNSTTYSEGWFTCDVQKEEAGTKGVTAIYVKENHKAGDTVKEISYEDAKSSGLYIGEDFSAENMLKAANWNFTIAGEDGAEATTDYTVYTVTGGCDQAQYKVFACSVCREVIVTELAKAGKHSYKFANSYVNADGETVAATAPTYTVAGTIFVVCANGDAEVATITLPALSGLKYDSKKNGYYNGNTLVYKVVSKNAATCSVIGRYSLKFVLSGDDAKKYGNLEYSVTILQDKLDHDLGSGVKTTWIYLDKNNNLWKYVGTSCKACGSVVVESCTSLGSINANANKDYKNGTKKIDVYEDPSMAK